MNRSELHYRFFEQYNELLRNSSETEIRQKLESGKTSIAAFMHALEVAVASGPQKGLLFKAIRSLPGETPNETKLKLLTVMAKCGLLRSDPVATFRLLESACSSGNTDLTKALVSHLAGKTDENGNTALHIVCAYGTEELIKEALQWPCFQPPTTRLGRLLWTDPFVKKNHLDHNCTHSALLNPQADKILELLSQATPRTFFFRSLILKACKMGDSIPNDKGLQYALDRCTDGDYDSTPYIPLLEIASLQNTVPRVAFLLLKLAFDRLPQDETWDPPLIEASRQGHYHLVLEMLKTISMAHKTNKKTITTTLIGAICLGWPDVAKELIQVGADLCQRYTENSTALHIACINHQVEIGKLLISKQENCNEVDSNGYTPLHYACKEGLTSLVKALIDKGANIDAVAKDGETPLTQAIRSKANNVVQLLLDYGVKINSDNPKALSPLIVALEAGAEDIALTFFDKGVSPHHDPDENSPLSVALVRGHVATIKKLLDLGADKRSLNELQLHLACLLGDLSTVQELLSHGANVHLDKRGTPLHYACSTGQDEIVKVLLENGADIDGITYGLNARAMTAGATPLACAVANKQHSTIDLLLASGAKPSCGDIDPLTIAVRLSEEDIAHKLINAEASADLSSLLEAAIAFDLVKLADTLISKGANLYSVSDGVTALNIMKGRLAFAGSEALARVSNMNDGRSQEILARILLAHRFGLSGETDILDQHVALEGFPMQTMFFHLHKGLRAYYNKLACDGHLNPRFWNRVLTRLSPAAREAVGGLEPKKIIEVLENTLAAVHYSTLSTLDDVIKRSLDGQIVALEVDWREGDDAHMAGVAGLNRRIARFEKGGVIGGKSGIRIQTLNRPENQEEAFRKLSSSNPKQFFMHDIEEALGLSDEFYTYKKIQKVGNCSSATSNLVEEALYQLQFELLLEANIAQELSSAIKKERVRDSKIGSVQDYLDIHRSKRRWPPDVKLVARIYEKSCKKRNLPEITSSVEEWVADRGMKLTQLMDTLKPTPEPIPWPDKPVFW